MEIFLISIMYVYIYLDPTEPGIWTYKEQTFNNRPLYVGIGTKHSRRTAHWRNARHKYEGKASDKGSLYINPILYLKLLNLIKQNKEPIIQKLYIGESKDTICQHEKDMISVFGRIKDKNGGILCNIGEGGEYQRIGTITNQCKAVVKFDLTGKRICEYESVAHADRDAVGKKGLVGYHIRGNSVTAYGHIYKYKSEVGDVDTIDVAYLKDFKGNVGSREIEVHKYDLNGNYLESYSSYTDAAAKTGISEGIIRTSAHKQNYSSGSIWSTNKSEKLTLNTNNTKSVLYYHTPIYEFNLHGDMIPYKSVAECSLYHGLKERQILKFVKNNYIHDKCRFWSFDNTISLPKNYIWVIDMDNTRKMMLKIEASKFCGVADYRTLGKYVKNNTITIKTKRHQDNSITA